MAIQNGVGPSVLRAILGTALIVQWTPELSASIGGDHLQGLASIDVTPTGANGNATPIITFTFLARGAGGSQRTATVSRAASAFAATTDNSGFTATLAAM